MGIFKSLSMSSTHSKNNTVIDSSIVIRGHVNIVKGGLHIQGLIEGDIISGSEGETRVVIGKSGLVQGNIFADTVVVFGNVVGNIKCINIEILNGSSIEGDIQYQHIVVDGGKVMGKLLQITQGAQGLLPHQNNPSFMEQDGKQETLQTPKLYKKDVKNQELDKSSNEKAYKNKS